MNVQQLGANYIRIWGHLSKTAAKTTTTTITRVVVVLPQHSTAAVPAETIVSYIHKLQ